MAIRLVLVRHGLSSFNAKGLIQGRTDDSILTDEGYEQARKAGKALSKINFDKILRSNNFSHLISIANKWRHESCNSYYPCIHK